MNRCKIQKWTRTDAHPNTMQTLESMISSINMFLNSHSYTQKGSLSNAKYGCSLAPKILFSGANDLLVIKNFQPSLLVDDFFISAATDLYCSWVGYCCDKNSKIVQSFNEDKSTWRKGMSEYSQFIRWALWWRLPGLMFSNVLLTKYFSAHECPSCFDIGWIYIMLDTLLHISGIYWPLRRLICINPNISHPY